MVNLPPPGVLLALVGLVLLFIRSPQLRKAIILISPLIVLATIWSIPDNTVSLGTHFLFWDLVPVRMDPLGRLFATIFSLMAFAGGLFALRQKRVSELSAAFVYAGGAIGVALAGDLITVFIFWELMAIASTVVIWSAVTPESYKASIRYLMLHLLGGVILMAGIIGHVVEHGDIAFQSMSPDSWSHILILVGFLINAGAPPFSSWLSDAYPEASYTGTVFLSAFTTKTAVYVLIRGFPGTEILIYLGLFMVFYGIVYALLENDMRRILVYSIINQVGFMVVGIGIGTEMALNGAAAHAFAHIIYKGLLLMSAGAVLYRTNERKCSNLGGLFQSMPLTTICGTIGALAISSFPFTSGFVSKSMIATAAAEQHLAFVWYLLAAASAGVFLHAGIKFPWFVFFQKDSGMRPKDPPWNMSAAMVLFAALCIGIGCYPDPLYALLPYATNYVPYTVPHVVNMLQLLLFAGLAFFLLLPWMKRTLTITLDLDWLYRRLFPRVWVVGSAAFIVYQQRVSAFTELMVYRTIMSLKRIHGGKGLLSRNVSTNSASIGALVLLCVWLVSFYK
ncbi:MAG: Na(+)/H(+) antiporter subunit D [Magnetococcales bacterium]|nr:Na(+)/H(+) antiporter subunit D [Magnetococcales bacterium]